MFMMLHLIKRPTISQWSHLFSQQQSTKRMTITVVTLKSPLLWSTSQHCHTTLSLTNKYLSHRDLTPTTFILVTAAIQDNNTLVIDHIGLSTSKKDCFVCSTKSPLKVMKNAFYFILKSFFVLKIFNFLS